jgi:hypothetical protein
MTEKRYKGLSLYGVSLYLPINRDIVRPRYKREHITIYKRGRTDTLDSNARSKI